MKIGVPSHRFEAVRDILKSLGVQSVRLITNNPHKVEVVKKLGVQVTDTIPCVVEPKSEAMRKHIEKKASEGHMISK